MAAYRDGTPFKEVLEGGWCRDFQPQQVIDECAELGYIIDTDFYAVYKKNMDFQMDQWFKGNQVSDSLNPKS